MTNKSFPDTAETFFPTVQSKPISTLRESTCRTFASVDDNIPWEGLSSSFQNQVISSALVLFYSQYSLHYVYHF